MPPVAHKEGPEAFEPMTQRLDDDTTRQQALTHWHDFCSRFLPGTVRRIAAWKGLSLQRQAELRAELRQELAADCLQHAQQVVLQPTAVRHGRWMRLAERYVYRNYVAVPRQQPPTEAACLPAEPGVPPLLATPPDLEVIGNGRRNLLGTAKRHGIDARSLRRHLDWLAERLGDGDEHRDFWRARLAEALTGLAADLLRDRDQVHLLPRARGRPDPAGRLRRMRRMLVHFHIRPATQRERTILRRWLRRPALDAAAPRRLLESAVTLAPGDRATWLWLFEACLVDGDLRAAAAALRRCRQQAAPTAAAATLARARLLEARGRHQRAIAVVRRGARRWPRDAALRTVAARLADLAGLAAGDPRAANAVSSH